MRLAPPPLVIADKEGFQRDTFQSKEAAERLAQVVTKLEGHAVIVLDGDWGSGKTTFIKQWAGLMRTQHNRAVVYLDAFQMDHHDDPFFVMLARVLAILDDDLPGDLADSLIGYAAKVIRAVPGAAANLALEKVIPFLTHGLLSADDLVIKSDTPDDWIKAQLKMVDNETASVAKFRNTLTDVVKQTPMDAPLVFVIDELDRCKPTFALSVLERMKHIFAADGICFILVTHLRELTEMVRHAYGIRDASRYLDKFYHLRIDMDAVFSTSGVEIVSKYLQHLSSTTAPVFFKYQGDTMIGELVAIHDLGLRAVERMAIGLLLYERTGSERYSDHPAFLVVGLCVLRTCNVALYRKATSGEMTFEDACSFFGFDSWEDQVTAESAREVWGAFVLDSPDRMLGKHVGKHALPREMVLPDICRHIDLFWKDDTETNVRVPPASTVTRE